MSRHLNQALADLILEIGHNTHELMMAIEVRFLGSQHAEPLLDPCQGRRTHGQALAFEAAEIAAMASCHAAEFILRVNNAQIAKRLKQALIQMQLHLMNDGSLMIHRLFINSLV